MKSFRHAQQRMLCARLAAAGVAVVCLTAASVWSNPRGDDERPPEGGGTSVTTNPLSLSTPSGTSASGGFMWVGAEMNYKITPVLCNGVNIGRLDYKYRTHKDTGWNPDTAGMALEGGFTANGMSPCIFGQQPGTEYFWIQTIVTNRPKAGRGPGEYTDSTNPRKDPAYPYGSDNNNPMRNPFTGRSFYDAPERSEEAARSISWLAENILCCRTGTKINMIGSFLWGFHIATDGMPNDGNVGVSGTAPFGWGPPTQSAMDTVAAEAKGTKTEKGWTVDTGCCCAKIFLPFFCFCDSSGLCNIPINVGDPEMILDRIVVFPRNRQVTTFTMPPAPGWSAQPWSGGSTAPPLAWQTQGSQMFFPGILFINNNPQPGMQSLQMQMRVSGHESFFDIFVHDNAHNHWFPWASQTQELLADMNGDSVIDSLDLPAWDLAFNNPAGYSQQYPGLNPIFRGDLNHDNVLDPPDRSLLLAIINTHLEFDARNLGPLPCPGDVAPQGGNHFVNVDDLLAIINGWGACPQPCPPYCNADVDHNCFVNVDDLLLAINHWGPCPQ